MNRKVLATILILVAVLSAVPITSASAVGCTGSGCTGKDPSAQGCTADSYTVGSYTGSGSSGSVTGALKYSPACNANWSRATTSSGNRYIRAEVSVYGYQYQWVYGTGVNSYMVDGTSWHCAVGFVDTTNETYYNTFSGSSSLAAACG
jgi:hypothetical protein